MKLKANCSFTGLRGTRAYNEVFEVPDEEGQMMLDEGYPVDVIDGPQAEQPAAEGEAAEPEKEGQEVSTEGADGTTPSVSEEDKAQGQVEAEQPAAEGEAAEPEKEGADGSAKPKTSGGQRAAQGGRAKASKA